MNGRTFQRPRQLEHHQLGSSPELWFAGAPQTLTADYLLEGATAATGHAARTLSPRDFTHRIPSIFCRRTIPAVTWPRATISRSVR